MSTKTASASVVVTPAPQGITSVQKKTSNLQSDSFFFFLKRKCSGTLFYFLRLLSGMSCFLPSSHKCKNHLVLHRKYTKCAQLQGKASTSTTLHNTHHNMASTTVWCKMLHCLATCLVIWRRELAKACSEGGRKECVCVCARVCVRMCVYMPLTMSVQYVVKGSVPSGHRLSQSG